MLRTYSKFLDVVEKILRVILIILMSSMILIMFYQVIMRYVFSNAKPWCEELTLYLSIFCVFLGISIAMRRENHLQVDFLLNFCSNKVRCLMMSICSIIAVVFMIFFCIYGISLIQHATGKSTTLPLTMKQIYMAFPVGSILLILFSIENVFVNIFKYLGKEELVAKEGGDNS